MDRVRSAQDNDFVVAWRSKKPASSRNSMSPKLSQRLSDCVLGQVQQELRLWTGRGGAHEWRTPDPSDFLSRVVTP
jgi:hypothetical protein